MKKILIAAVAVLMVLGLGISQNASAQTQTTYTVKSGDTLWKISKRFQVGLSELIETNPQIENPDLIYPGEKIKIPKIPHIKNFEREVIRLTNNERTQRGLQPLKANWQLSRVARYKARDMRDKGYFSHNSPTYGSPFDMMKQFNISYSYAGENIAMGQPTPRAVVDAWMKSPGHRRNILNPHYTQIGVGFAKGGSGRYYWSQMFIKPR